MEIDALIEGFPKKWVWKPEWDCTAPAECPVASFVKKVGEIRFQYERKISYSADTG
jgi:hypothetical protein